MELIPHIQEAFSNLVSSKLRSALAVLGILVGTSSVVAMVMSGQLATKAALAQFKTLGTDLLSINLFPKDSSGSQAKDPFSLTTAMGLASSSKTIKKVAPYTTSYGALSYQGHTISGGSLVGVTQSLQPIIKIKMKQGRFISDLDNEAYYCVVGQKIAKQLRDFGALEPIGMQLRVGKNYFTVIGVAESWLENSFFNENINSSILIPIKTAKIISKYARINNVILDLRKNANIDLLEIQIKRYLEANASNMRTYFRSPKQLIERMKKQSQIFTLLLGLIGSISLLVGGIGVMNIMLVSVSERRREIGIRMAIGARRKDIRTLFLIESVALSLFGGLLGVILGLLITYIIAQFTNWQFEFFLLPPLVGFLVSVGIGIFFGFYPAHRASQSDPIACLRTD